MKVQFRWDRQGKNDEKSSCWIRVAHEAAGGGFGSVHIPRIGQEVVVSFLEGDPDRPIISGCVYNPDQMPAYKLPDKKMISGLKSNTYPGGGGNNEITVDDSKGHERMFLNAQYNKDEAVGNNRTAQVGMDATEEVGNNLSEKVGNDKQVSIVNNSFETVGNNMTLDVGTNLVITLGNVDHPPMWRLLDPHEPGRDHHDLRDAGDDGRLDQRQRHRPDHQCRRGTPLDQYPASSTSPNGVINRVEGSLLGHFGGSTAEVVGSSECLVQGTVVKIN